MKKVLLILADGMRPDSLEACGHPFISEILAHGTRYPAARTVMPSVTLPCHMSLFHSVAPERHGILTNTYVPQVRPVRGLYEVLRAAGKKGAIFYDWEELKDLSRPGALSFSTFLSGHDGGYEIADARLTALAKSYLETDAPDFVFLYLGWPDCAGHDFGWMGEEYLRAVRGSWDCIETICRGLDDEYLVIVTADHGGHGRSHGTELPEDMTIPILLSHRDLPAAEAEGGSILDIAPTVCSVLGVAPDGEWEGKPLAF